MQSSFGTVWERTQQENENDGFASLNPSYRFPERGSRGVFERIKKQPPESPFDKGDIEGFHAKKGSTSTAVSGTIPLVVIGVDFPDCPATYKPEQIQPLAFGATSSVADYYNDVSYSEVTITPVTESSGTTNDGFVGWLRMSGNHPNNGFDIDVAEAILASDTYVNYASYDANGDGYIEPTELSVMIIVAGYEAAYGYGSPSVWAHQWVTYVVVDGKTIEQYALFGEKHGNHLATVGVMCHELGHLMFTLPDLYDTDYSSIGIGDFDLMGDGGWGAAYGAYAGSSPTHLSAWCKEYLGWGTVNTISSSQSISLSKSDGNSSSIFRINTLDSNQYFLIENREFSGYDIGFQVDTGKNGHGGLVIYHIDKLKTDLWPDSNSVNDDEYDKGVDVEEANEGEIGYSLLDNYESSADTNMFFFSRNNTSFTNDTVPDSGLKNGASTNVSITNISAYGDTMTATVSLPDHVLYVLTDSATNLTTNSVKLNGIVNAMGLSAKAWFEYGTVTGLFSSKTSVQNISGMNNTPISVEISGLPPYTIYHHRLVAQAVEGVTWSGGNGEFAALMDNALTVSPRINAGAQHSLVLKSESTVWAWGYNADGELGDGTAIDRNTPVQTNGLNGIIAITGGWDSFALRSDGTVWGCGYNQDGRLGDGTTINRKIPVQVNGLSGITSISSGGWHCLALKPDGTVWSWGDNDNGQLGDGTYSSRDTPVRVKNISGIMAVAAGGAHNLALKSDGTVWAWGFNYFGQLGDGTMADGNVPVKVNNLSNVIAIAGGEWHSLALKADGTLWAWGDNRYGELGDGTNTDQSIPIQVKNLNGIIALTSGHSWHSLALRLDGTVWAWGNNYDGQLGDGTTENNRNTPVQVSGLNDITAVAVGTNGHSMALKSDGTVWTWGDNKYGQLGDGTTENKSTPVQVKDINLGRTPADNIPPACSIEINNGDSYTTSNTITLSLSAVDTIGVTGYYISTGSTTPSVSAQGWTSVSSTTFYAGSISYNLEIVYGKTTVYAWFKDAVGNISGAASDSIFIKTECEEEAASISASQSEITMTFREYVEETITVTGEGGCPVEGDSVRASVSNRLVTVSPRNKTTDENGRAVFTITANSKTGNAVVTFKDGSLSTQVNVTVKK